MNTMRAVLCTLVGMLTLAGCKSVTVGVGPGQIAEQYKGKPLADLELRLGAPMRESKADGQRIATWEFDACSVTARTDAHDTVTDVAWSPGCGHTLWN